MPLLALAAFPLPGTRNAPGFPGIAAYFCRGLEFPCAVSPFPRAKRAGTFPVPGTPYESYPFLAAGPRIVWGLQSYSYTIQLFHQSQEDPPHLQVN